MKERVAASVTKSHRTGSLFHTPSPNYMTAIDTFGMAWTRRSTSTVRQKTTTSCSCRRWIGARKRGSTSCSRSQSSLVLNWSLRGPARVTKELDEFRRCAARLAQSMSAMSEEEKRLNCSPEPEVFFFQQNSMKHLDWEWWKHSCRA